MAKWDDLEGKPHYLSVVDLSMVFKKPPEMRPGEYLRSWLQGPHFLTVFYHIIYI